MISEGLKFCFVVNGKSNASLAALSASSFPKIPQWPGTQMSLILMLLISSSRILMTYGFLLFEFIMALSEERESVQMANLPDLCFVNSMAFLMAMISAENIED